MAFVVAIPGVTAHHSIHTVGRTLRVALGTDAVIVLRIPVTDPFRNVADNVVNSVSVWGKRAHGDRTFRPAIMGEFLLAASTATGAPSSAARRELIPPRIAHSVRSA